MWQGGFGGIDPVSLSTGSQGYHMGRSQGQGR